MSDLDKIARTLESADEESRLHVIRKLADLPPEESLGLVFKGFGDESWRIRKEAIDLFLAMPVSRDLIGEIIELLHAEENAGLRNAAVEILTRMGLDAVPMLLDQARCPDPDVRKFIIDVLGDIASPQAIPTLIDGLEDEDSNVRASAAENLGKLKADEAVPAMLKAMANPDLLLQFTILDALSRIGVPIDFAHLQSFKDEKLLRKALMGCLGKVGDASAIAELVDSLTDSMRNVREAALLALSDIAERFPEQVRNALSSAGSGQVVMATLGCLEESGNPALQRAAVRGLGWMGATEALHELLGLLASEDLQQDSLRALVDIGTGNPRALVDAWSQTRGAQRAYLAYVLGEAGCRDGLELLCAALESDDMQLQQMAAYALGRLGEPKVLGDLVNCLQQSSAEVQEAATQALAHLGEAFEGETLEALQAVLGSDDAVQRKFAVSIVGRLSGPSVWNALNMALKDPDADVRRAAVKSYDGRDLGEHMSSLLLALTDEDPEVRRMVVDILSSSREEEALDGLQLALKDEDIWVRSSAVRGIGHLGGVNSSGLIEQSIDDPVGLVSIAALETLAGLVGDKACPRLVAALDHDDEEVVTAALDLLSHCSASDWFAGHMERLINHPFWAVRSHFARIAAQTLGAEALGFLEQRLASEPEDLVRQQLQDLIDDIKGF